MVWPQGSGGAGIGQGLVCGVVSADTVRPPSGDVNVKLAHPSRLVSSII